MTNPGRINEPQRHRGTEKKVEESMKKGLHPSDSSSMLFFFIALFVSFSVPLCLCGSPLIETVEYAAVGEELGLRFVPIVDERRDREQLDVGQPVRVLLEDGLVDRPVVVLSDDLLRCLGVEELQ